MRKRWKAHYTRNLDSLASKLNAFNLEKKDIIIVETRWVNNGEERVVDYLINENAGWE